MNTSSSSKGSFHVVVGSGPLGRATVRSLLSRGAQVRLVSREPKMDPADGLELRRADATDAEALREAVTGAAVIYNCANAPYHRWPTDLPPIWDGVLDAAREMGAALVIGTNLYAYGKPSGTLTTGEAAFVPCSRKGRVRAELEERALEAHRRGEVAVAIVRGSNLYGPEVRDSVLGSMFFPPLLAGKPATMYGGREVPHSYAYLPDFGDTMAAIGLSAEAGASAEAAGGADGDLFGRSWLVPHDAPVTVAELESALRELVPEARIKLMGRGMVRFGGLFVPAAREMVEMLYEFENPFVVDSRETEEKLGLRSTPLREGLRKALDWYRADAPQSKTDYERQTAKA